MALFRFACSNLLSRKVRSSLALLGLAVAIVGMVGLFSVVSGLKHMSEDAFSRIKGLIVLQPGAPIPLFSHLPADWGAEIAAVDGVKVVSPELWQRANVIEGKMTVSPPRFLFGADVPTWNKLEHALYRDDIVAGRFLNDGDRGTLNCVVSQPIADEFSLKPGDRFSVNGHELTVVGIYDAGSPFIDVTIVVDFSSVREMGGVDVNSVSAYFVEPEEGREKEVTEAIRNVFRGRPGDAWVPSDLRGATVGNPLESIANDLDAFIKSLGKNKSPGSNPAIDRQPNARQPAKEKPPRKRKQNKSPGEGTLRVDESVPVDVQSAETWGKRIEKMMGDLDFVMTILTAIGVTIAVLGVVNTMLMSVTERIIEIGILKANGWSRKNVLFLVAFESALLGFVGGTIGAFFGWIGTHVINANFPDRIQLYAGPGLLSFSILFATVLGVLAGLYPAFWAMRLMPMDAIRRG